LLRRRAKATRLRIPALRILRRRLAEALLRLVRLLPEPGLTGRLAVRIRRLLRLAVRIRRLLTEPTGRLSGRLAIRILRLRRLSAEPARRLTGRLTIRIARLLPVGLLAVRVLRLRWLSAEPAGLLSGRLTIRIALRLLAVRILRLRRLSARRWIAGCPGRAPGCCPKPCCCGGAKPPCPGG
jgi:hypothetical protein